MANDVSKKVSEFPILTEDIANFSAAGYQTSSSGEKTSVRANIITPIVDGNLVEKQGTQLADSGTKSSDFEQVNNKVASITDANKTSLTLYPSNAAVTAQLDLKANTADVTAELATKADLTGGLVPSTQLPSYVDDVVELLNIAGTIPSSPAEADKYFDPTTSKIETYTSATWVASDPEKGKIYISTDTNYQYRWSGTALIHINVTDLSGYVDLTTDQTISGTKTFASTVKTNSIRSTPTGMHGINFVETTGWEEFKAGDFTNDIYFRTFTPYLIAHAKYDFFNVYSGHVVNINNSLGVPILSTQEVAVSVGDESNNNWKSLLLSYGGTDYIRLNGNTTKIDIYEPINSSSTITATNLIGTNTGDETQTTILNKIIVLPITNGGTGATTAAAARTNLGAAASGANADITSITGLTGNISFTASDVSTVGSNTNPALSVYAHRVFGDTSSLQLGVNDVVKLQLNTANQLTPVADNSLVFGGASNAIKNIYTYGLTFGATITPVGTTGAQTINKSAGRVNVAAGATSIVVTNSLVTANSIITAVAATADATCVVKSVVAAAGSFTINVVAPTTETAINFIIIN